MGDVRNGFVPVAFHESTGLAGTENIDAADKRRLLLRTEALTVGTNQIVLFDNHVDRITQ